MVFHIKSAARSRVSCATLYALNFCCAKPMPRFAFLRHSERKIVIDNMNAADKKVPSWRITNNQLSVQKCTLDYGE